MAEIQESAAAPVVRPVGIVMDPTEAHEAEGVTIRRTVGSERLVLLDPVLLLDHLQVTLSEGTNSLGFPRHPHRGIETLTYVFGGRIHHRDSLGNDSSVGKNGSQWMTAGGGIFHEEMLEAGDGEGSFIEALQIWFNLPAAQKMTRPGYQPATAEEIPTVALADGATVRVIAGTFAGVTGPFTGIAVNPLYLDVQVPAGVPVTLPAPAGETAFAYVFQGKAIFGAEQVRVEGPRLVIFGDGDTVSLAGAIDSPVRVIFVSARPLNEPVLQYRSLVMNTVEQMRQALADLEAGTLAQTE
jgi:hypothetical protein